MLLCNSNAVQNSLIHASMIRLFLDCMIELMLFILKILKCILPLEYLR